MNGTLRVVACLTNHPCLNCGVSASGTGLVLSGTSGIANGQFYVLGSTNLATPLTQWTRLATNWFDGSGCFVLTNMIGAGQCGQYIVIQVP